MASHQLTVTGKQLAGQTVTAKVYKDISRLTFDLGGTLHILKSDGNTDDIDITAATTITITVSSGIYTAAIS